MNKPNTDSELQSILQEARENYQKRIQSLKHSMQVIIKDLPCDRPGLTERPNYSQRTQITQKPLENRELVQSLSKIQVLEIENQNLKSILQKENFECSTPPKKTHKRISSCKNESSRELSGLKELLSLTEKENRELRTMIEVLKEKSSNHDIDFKEKIQELNEEVRFLIKKNRELEDGTDRMGKEIEAGKKDKAQILIKAQRFEDKVKGLQGEVTVLENEIKRAREKKDPVNANFFKYKSKAKALKEKLQEMTEKNDRNFKTLVEKEGKVMELGQELRNALEKVADKESCIEMMGSETEELKNKLEEVTGKLAQCEKDLSALKSSKSAEKISLQQSQNELVSAYESKIVLIQQEFSEKAAKMADDIKLQVEQSYKTQLQASSEKISEQSLAISALNEELTGKSSAITNLQSELLELKSKNSILEQEFAVKQEEFKEIYNKITAQHKSDVSSLEAELQKLYETKSQTSSDIEIMIEKYKILKNEYFAFQQNCQISLNMYEKQQEDLKKACLIQEKELVYYKSKEDSWNKELEVLQEKTETLIKELRNSTETNTKLKADLVSYKEKLSLDQKKLARMKDLVKVSIKQIKNEFFQIVKQCHRGVFEDLLTMKKCLTEYFQVLNSKLSLNFQSWVSLLNSHSLSKKHLQDHFNRESQDFNSIKLHFSQLERELQIKDDRILYLESSLKNSLARTRPYDPDVLKGLYRQVSYLEESYTNDYQDLVDLIITLKAYISKEHMESVNELANRGQQKDFLLKQARNELAKHLIV